MADPRKTNSLASIIKEDFDNLAKKDRLIWKKRPHYHLLPSRIIIMSPTFSEDDDRLFENFAHRHNIEYVSNLVTTLGDPKIIYIADEKMENPFTESQQELVSYLAHADTRLYVTKDHKFANLQTDKVLDLFKK